MATVYLIPSLLHEEGIHSLPVSLTEAIRNCTIFFAENERTTRRYFKQLWKSFLPTENMVIDDYEWFTIGEDSAAIFRQKLKENKTIGIISEAGCPGIADPGQALVAIAQEMNATVKPLVGPSSILLALMASGMNGQQFRFAGYLPIDNHQRVKTIKEWETESARKNCTQVFIETPYRNNQLLEAILKTCNDSTKLCIAINLTGKEEKINTKTISQWKKNTPDLHKKLVIYCLHANAAGPV
jgi:16S rRNA (cytidine1402-2'-O)-methyltransferase